MGVVNLSILIEKLKKALSGEYVKKTDKASASAFGVVKVGNNISVSSGKISVPVASDSTAGVVKVGSGLAMEDGVLSVTASGGMTVDVLYSGNIVKGSATPVMLSHPYTDYVFLVASSKTSDYESTQANLKYVGDIATGTNNANNIGLFSFRVDGENFDRFTTIGSGTVANVTILGIK